MQIFLAVATKAEATKEATKTKLLAKAKTNSPVDLVDSNAEEDEDEENSSEESDFTLRSKPRSKTSTPEYNRKQTEY